MYILLKLFLSVLTIYFFQSKEIAATEPESIFVQAENFQSIQECCLKAPPQTLFVFDIDHTLIYQPDPALHPEILHSAITKLSIQDCKKLFGIIWSEASLSLVDPESIELLKNLQTAGQKTILLTKATTGRFCSFESFEHSRLERLRSLGLDFSGSFPTVSEKIALDPAPSTFVQGMISTSNGRKDKPLHSFLRYIHNETKYTPGKIIFVDDDAQNVKQIQAYCLENSIPFEGIHYTRAYSLLKIDNGRQDIFDLQYKIVLAQERWISYEEACDLIKKIK